MASSVSSLGQGRPSPSATGRCLRLFNTLTTFGTPQDVSLQGVRVEISFAMDAESDVLLSQVAQVILG
jgi:hypothetical protein